MSLDEAERCTFNPFDLTKVWSHSQYPLIEVGRMTLDRNPENYFAEVEQSAFSPANFVPGIEASPDKMLQVMRSGDVLPLGKVLRNTSLSSSQGRLFSYDDTHRHRLGANFVHLPINCPYRYTVTLSSHSLLNMGLAVGSANAGTLSLC